MRRIEFLLVRVIVGCLGVLPLGWAYGLAETLVGAYLAVSGKYRERTLAHLDIAFGDTRDGAWKHDLYRTCHRYLAWYFVDILLAPKLLSSPRRRAAVDLTQFDEVLRRDGVTKERGALLIAAHQGAPEIASLAAALGGWPNAVVLRALDNPFLWDWIQERRSHIPRQAIHKIGGLRPAHRVLRRKGIVGIQTDQDGGSKGLFVPYFGVPASTSSGAASLALTSGASVYFLTCLRTAPREFAYELRLEGPLEFEPSGDAEKDVLDLTAAITAGTERMVRACPEQVMWAHRRWKSRPPE